MTDIKLRLACWDYDRIEPLANGKVKPTGIDLNVEKLWLQEIFYRMLTKKEFDLSELSFGAYTVSLFEENPPFIAIPVFPSRMFRHGSIYINKDSGIERPEDLMGKRIGLPEYRQTAVVWIKGFLKDIYGVENTAVKYYTGPLEKANSKYFYNLSKTDVTKLYKDVDIRKINDGKTLSDMLLYGELDALYSAIEPSGFKKNDGKVVRLYSNPKDVEMKYFGDTGIFPIMHVIAIRREIYEENNRYNKTQISRNISSPRLLDCYTILLPFHHSF